MACKPFSFALDDQHSVMLSYQRDRKQDSNNKFSLKMKESDGSTSAVCITFVKFLGCGIKFRKQFGSVF